MTEIRLLGIVGSLRKESLNRRALQAFKARLPEGASLTIADIADIPLYNADIAENEPPPVELLKQLINAAQGVVIATPEFNYGLPGVLKNTLDWASRPAYKSVFAHKPVTMLGASPAPVGTARAQGQLKQVLLGMLADIYPAPELTIGLATQKLTSDGDVSDDQLDSALRRLAAGFCEWSQARAR